MINKQRGKRKKGRETEKGKKEENKGGRKRERKRKKERRGREEGNIVDSLGKLRLNLK